MKQEAAGQTVATEDKATHKATEVKGTIKEGVGRDVTIAMTALHVLGIVVLDREANSAATPRTST